MDHMVPSVFLPYMVQVVGRCLKRLVNHSRGGGCVPHGVRVGRSLTRLVNHHPGSGVGDLRIDKQLEGCLALKIGVKVIVNKLHY